VFSGDFTELAEKNYEKKTSARIDGIRAVIWTRNLPTTKQAC
jgi:hypothetical protein